MLNKTSIARLISVKNTTSKGRALKKKDQAPRKHREIKAFVKKGLIIVHTGGGKGKSTAAFGTAIRAIGRGWKVAIVQFIKGQWQTGEVKFLNSLKGKCQVFVIGDGFTWDTKNFTEDVKTAQRAWKKCCEIIFLTIRLPKLKKERKALIVF